MLDVLAEHARRREMRREFAQARQVRRLIEHIESATIQAALKHVFRFTGIEPAARQDRSLTVFPVISSQGMFLRENER